MKAIELIKNSEEDITKFGEYPFTVCVDLEALEYRSKYLSYGIYGIIGSYTPDIWYFELYKVLAKVFKKDEDSMNESDYYVMHFDFDKKDKAFQCIEYLSQYLRKVINDDTIMDYFKSLDDEEKIKSIQREEFFNKYFKLHTFVYNKI
jgi:hypothetical protein